MEDNLRWAVIDVFGERLHSFLTEVFAEISIGSDSLRKELESKAVRKSRRTKPPVSQAGTSATDQTNSSVRKTPTRSRDDSAKSPRGTQRRKR